jgi:hypothetical protein
MVHSVSVMSMLTCTEVSSSMVFRPVFILMDNTQTHTQGKILGFLGSCAASENTVRFILLHIKYIAELSN